MKLCKYPKFNCFAQYHGKETEIMCCTDKCQQEINVLTPMSRKSQKDIISDMAKIARNVLEKKEDNKKRIVYCGDGSVEIEDDFAFDDSMLSGPVDKTDWKEHSQKLFEVTLMQHKEITELKERIGKTIAFLGLNNPGPRNIMNAIRILKGEEYYII